MEAYGCGELHPIAPNATEEGRQNNRRVEFHIVQPGAQEVRRGCEQIDLR
jgi:OOP family OmpA-OmpF porin